MASSFCTQGLMRYPCFYFKGCLFSCDFRIYAAERMGEIIRIKHLKARKNDNMFQLKAWNKPLTIEHDKELFISNNSSFKSQNIMLLKAGKCNTMNPAIWINCPVSKMIYKSAWAGCL